MVELQYDSHGMHQPPQPHKSQIIDYVPLSLQNEEVLKKCAQDYLMRIKQEEQRYQTLKVHAEEKLDK